MNININKIENLKNEISSLKQKITNDFVQIIPQNNFEELKQEYNSFKIEYNQDVNNFKIKANIVDLVVSDTGLNATIKDLEKTYLDCLHEIFNKQVCEIVSISKAKKIGIETGYKFVGTTEDCWKYCDNNGLVAISGYPVNAFKTKDSSKIKGEKFYTDENYIPWDCVE